MELNGIRDGNGTEVGIEIVEMKYQRKGWNGIEIEIDIDKEVI